VQKILLKNKRKKILSIIFIFSVLAFTQEKIEKYEFPIYRVVIDPGHGGVFFKDKERHGDKFDLVTDRYLEYFAEGANLYGIYERDIVFDISKRVLKYLDMCSPDGDFEKFKKIFARFSDGKIKRVYIDTIISREDSIPFEEAKNIEDPNSSYRLYDYKDRYGEIQEGRISKINFFKPHLVVSLHLAESAPPDYIGMSGIIIPPYKVLRKGFDILKDNGNGKIDDNGILESWFKESRSVSYRHAFLKDVSQYFIGYGIKKNKTIDYRDFKGYKYNMVSWIYRDDPGWHLHAREHKPFSQYSDNYETFKEEGRFWEREKSIYEEYRRGNSFKDFGGDNYFATYEIIKYILLSLHTNGIKKRDMVPGKPFISTWSVPLLINAISAYIELGYLDRKWDRDMLLNNKEEIAQGVAVGIYSLIAGADDIKGNFKHKPSGKRIDFEKYRISNEKTYFDIVTE